MVAYWIPSRTRRPTNCGAIRISKCFRKRFLARRMLFAISNGRVAMSIVQLTSSQRHKLQVELRRADDASHYRRLLAILELDRGKTVAEVAATLDVTRQSVYNWACSFATCPE